MSAAPIPITLDCRSCGACCAAGLLVEVRTGDDVPPELVDGFNYMRLVRDAADKMSVGCERCVALEGKVWVNCSCSIYERRPEVCKNYKPGSARCHLERNRYETKPAWRRS